MHSIQQLTNLCHYFSFQRNNFIEAEADEEEEESGQAGLGDFGFGTTKNFKDLDDEKVWKKHIYNYLIEDCYMYT
jgi:hypothetical protein